MPSHPTTQGGCSLDCNRRAGSCPGVGGTSWTASKPSTHPPCGRGWDPPCSLPSPLAWGLSVDLPTGQGPGAGPTIRFPILPKATRPYPQPHLLKVHLSLVPPKFDATLPAMDPAIPPQSQAAASPGPAPDLFTLTSTSSSPTWPSSARSESSGPCVIPAEDMYAKCNTSPRKELSFVLEDLSWAPGRRTPHRTPHARGQRGSCGFTQPSAPRETP